ncbi:MAG TPA: hypothetical protein VKO83_06400, partial [Steroidobacteraceae bacterium]|nr:hypothetical protein [Steroidobacteraceae bacterium]
MSEAPSARPKGRSIRPLAALWPFLRPYRLVFAAAILALVVASGALMVLPVAGRHLIDQGMVPG